jgi:hypothetical protein
MDNTQQEEGNEISPRFIEHINNPTVAAKMHKNLEVVIPLRGSKEGPSAADSQSDNN